MLDIHTAGEIGSYRHIRAAAAPNGLQEPSLESFTNAFALFPHSSSPCAGKSIFPVGAFGNDGLVPELPAMRRQCLVPGVEHLRNRSSARTRRREHVIESLAIGPVEPFPDASRPLISEAKEASPPCRLQKSGAIPKRSRPRMELSEPRHPTVLWQIGRAAAPKFLRDDLPKGVG